MEYLKERRQSISSKSSDRWPIKCYLGSRGTTPELVVPRYAGRIMDDNLNVGNTFKASNPFHPVCDYKTYSSLVAECPDVASTSHAAISLLWGHRQPKNRDCSGVDSPLWLLPPYGRKRMFDPSHQRTESPHQRISAVFQAEFLASLYVSRDL